MRKIRPLNAMHIIQITEFSLYTVLILSILGSFAYLPGYMILGSFKSNYIPMAPSTSLALFGFSMVMLFYKGNPSRKIYLIPAYTLTLLGFFYGIFIWLNFLTPYNLNFEDFIFNDFGVHQGIIIARMSPITGFTLSLCALAFLLLLLSHTYPIKTRLYKRIAKSIAFLILAFSFLLLFFYLIGKPLFYSIPGFIPMAFSTALAFSFLSLGLLGLTSRHYPFRFIDSRLSITNLLTNYLLPLTLASTFLGFLTSLAFPFFRHSPGVLPSVEIILLLAFSAYTAYTIANHLGNIIDREEEKRRYSQQELVKSEEKYRTLFETMSQGVVYQNTQGEIISANPAALRILGLTLSQIEGRTSIDPRWRAVDQDKNPLEGPQHPAMLALASGEAVRDFIQGIYNPQINDYVWIIVNSIPLYREGEDKPFQVYSTFLDFTKQKNAEDELRAYKERLQGEVDFKTAELKQRLDELERFYEATINRELRMKDMQSELDKMRKSGKK